MTPAPAPRRLPDLAVDVRTDDDHVGRLLDDVLAGLQDDGRHEPATAAEQVRIDLRDDGSYELTLDDSPAARHADPRVAVGAVVEHLNRRVLETTRDAVLVHAGAVELEGRGILVSAPSGSGKTTLTAALLARGAAYLTDETAVVDAATLQLRPYPKPLSVKASGHRLFDELGVPLQGTGPWLVPAGALGARTGAPCPVEVVVLPRRSDHDHLESLSRAQGLVELAKQAFPLGPTARERFLLLGRLAESARFVRADWTDPLATAERLLEDLDTAP